MNIIKINGIGFSELTVGHMYNLHHEIDVVMGVFSGNAAGTSDGEFLWCGFVVLAASKAIAESGAAAPRTSEELRGAAEDLRFSLGKDDVVSGLMHALYLKPATSASDANQKKLTG